MLKFYETDVRVLLWAGLGIWFLFLLCAPMACGYLRSSNLIIMSHQTCLKAILDFHLAHYANKSFWLAYDIEIRINNSPAVTPCSLTSISTQGSAVINPDVSR